MSIGDTIDVVIWDRNFEENWIWNKAENMKLYDPEVFFKSNRHKLTYKGDMIWDITFPFGKTITHPIHIDISNIQTDWKWCVIDGTDGEIHITHKVDGTAVDKPIHINWSDFPENTRVGWRGPIMLWSELKKLPQVYVDANARL